jgi:hypothetical protein
MGNVKWAQIESNRGILTGFGQVPENSTHFFGNREKKRLDFI